MNDLADTQTSGPEPRPGILEIAAYVGGESGLDGQGPVLRLAANESHKGPSPAAIAAYNACAGELHRYPEGGSAVLREAIASVHGLEAERIVCGAGSDELLHLLASCYAGPGDEVLYSAHGFMMYPIAARSVGATPVAAPETGLTADVDAFLERVNDRTKVIYLANPNNPTGTYIDRQTLWRLHAGLPNRVLLVLDAAYAEFVTRNDYDSGASLVRASDNVVMTRTFSKIHGLAALRLGWAYCPPAVADALNRVRGPFNVTAPAQAAGAAAIRDTAFMEAVRRKTQEALDLFTDRIHRMGLRAPRSVGNFLLVTFPEEPGKTAAEAYDSLVDERILTRRVGGYGLPSSLRVGMGSPRDMARVADCLERFLARAGGATL